MLVYTADEVLLRGLCVFNFTAERQSKASPETNVARFANLYCQSPEAAACLWDDLQTTVNDDARIVGSEKMFYYSHDNQSSYSAAA